jgi:hypothetical protein
MGETTNEIENHIEETRSELNENLSELERKVKNAVDWRSQFEERPGTMLGLALGAGVVLSAILPMPRRRRRDTYDAPSYRTASWEPPSGYQSPGSRQAASSKASEASSSYQLAPSQKDTAQSKSAPPGELRKTIEALESALMVMAVTKATGLIDSLVPGFAREFSKARYGKNDYRSEPVERGMRYPDVENAGTSYEESSRPKTSAATGD